MTLSLNLANRLIKFLLEGKKAAKINRRLNRLEIGRKTTRLKTYPSLLLLEPATLCNLKCPFCPTGEGTLALKREVMQPETFHAIVSNIRLKFLFQTNLFNWGEPFLNPHIFDYIRFFHQHGIFTCIHTNFSVKDYDSDFFENLVLCGLDDLTVSIDGASQETYEKYRVGGDFKRVVANMAGVAKAKKDFSSATPSVSYKMLLNKFNESEVNEAERIAESVGAEFRLDEKFDVPQHLRDEWLASSVRQKYGDAPPAFMEQEETNEIYTYCRQMWDTLTVNANGDLFPCCLVADHSMAVGNLAREHIDNVWNNAKMIKLREFALDPTAPAPDFPNLCERCSHRYCTHKHITGAALGVVQPKA